MRPHPRNTLKVISALLSPLPGKQEEFLQTIRSLQAEILGQSGCLDCTVAQDVSGSPMFVLVSIWEDLAFLEAHLDSEPFRVLLGATSVLTAPAGFRFVAADSAFSTEGFLAGRHGPRACPASAPHP